MRTRWRIAIGLVVVFALLALALLDRRTGILMAGGSLLRSAFLQIVDAPPGDPDDVDFWLWQWEKGTAGMQESAPGILAAKHKGAGEEDQARIRAAFIQMLSHPDAKVRFFAVFFLSEDLEAREHMRPLAAGDPDDEVRELANRAIQGTVRVCPSCGGQGTGAHSANKKDSGLD